MALKARRPSYERNRIAPGPPTSRLVMREIKLLLLSLYRYDDLTPHPKNFDCGL